MTNPYDILYIYEIAGRVENAECRFFEHFHGAWIEPCDEGDYTFLFFSVPSETEVKTAVSELSLKYCSETVMPYSQWEAGDKIRPFKVGRFFVYPQWESCQPPSGSIGLPLDPGLAFGSGFHPTTKTCLNILSQRFERGEFPKRVFDFGAGTAILAIAAGLLGAEKVVAVEYNNLSAKTARRNVHHNAMEEVVEVIEGDALVVGEEPADLLIANLTYPVLHQLSERGVFNSSCEWLLSGLRPGEAKRLIEKLKNRGKHLVHHSEREDWCTLWYR